jgi:aspartyl-tRNA(Asn)/glutamyl-tRNA(Gln) amidotransferase subunit C
MAITRTDVEKIAELSRIELTVEETDLFTEQLSSILAHVEKLNELDIEDTPPMSHCAPGGGDVEYAKRDDEVRPSLGQELAVANAPDPEAGYFKVPRVIGGKE